MEVALQQPQPPNLLSLQKQLQRDHKRPREEWNKIKEMQERMQVTLAAMDIEREALRRQSARIVEETRRLEDMHLSSPAPKK